MQSCYKIFEGKYKIGIAIVLASILKAYKGAVLWGSAPGKIYGFQKFSGPRMGVDCRDPMGRKKLAPFPPRRIPENAPTEFPLLHFSFKMIDQTNQTIIDLNKKYQRNLKDR